MPTYISSLYIHIQSPHISRQARVVECLDIYQDTLIRIVSISNTIYRVSTYISSLILQAPPKLPPYVLEGLVRTKHSLLYYSVWPIPPANLSHHRVQKFAITTITDGNPINRWGKPIHPVFPSTCSCFTTRKDRKSWSRASSWFERMCRQSIFSRPYFADLFRALQAPCGVASNS